ncbi:MAG: type IV pilus modification protein PilV [Gammaproteobacteria bacterium]|jgi:type IV pilus assembly protein PilV
MKFKQRQLGIGMVEVLVTLVIISVGFLNMAALQTTAKRSNFDAVQRTTAVMLAHDIVERMRANPGVLETYLTNGVGGGTLGAPARDCGAGVQCTPLQLAVFDLYEWEQAIDGVSESRIISGTLTQTGGLANPTACVTGPAGGGPGIYTITIVWRGLAELSNTSASPCGALSGSFGAALEFRRILAFNSYISS